MDLKKFTVIKFEKDNSVDVVPSKWIVQSDKITVKFPKYKNSNTIKLLEDPRSSPKDNWPAWVVEIIKSYGKNDIPAKTTILSWFRFLETNWELRFINCSPFCRFIWKSAVKGRKVHQLCDGFQRKRRVKTPNSNCTPPRLGKSTGNQRPRRIEWW